MTSDSDHTRIKLLRWLPAIIWAAVIFWCSSRSTSPIPLIPIPHADKGIHFTEFFILCYSICHAQEPSGQNFRRIMWRAVLMTSVYGALDEYHQSFTPERTPEVADWMADTAGAVVAGFVWLTKQGQPSDHSRSDSHVP